MKDEHGQVLYIGKAKNLRNRVSSYFQKNGDTRERIPFLMKRVCSIETIVVSNETEALLLENNLIKQYHPRYNVLLKDDKTFFCLSISLSHPWPKIDPVRTRALNTSTKQLLFGPYVSAEACKTLLEIISQWFPLRTCSNREFALRKRPCVLYEMKRCLAPCVGLCSKEDYQQTLEKAIHFLKGNIQEVVDSLKTAIQEASRQQKFEQAAAYYRTLTLIDQAMTDQYVETFHFKDIDAIGLHRQREAVVISVLTVRSGKLLGARHFIFQENAQEDQDLITSFLMQYYANQPQIPREILTPISLCADLPYLLKASNPPRLSTPKSGYGKQLLQLAKNNARLHLSASTPPIPYEEIKKLLHLEEIPYRIECYDNAHLQGQHGVGVYIVWENDRFAPESYRTFSLTKPDNDLASLQEVLSRRLQDLTSPLPNLILVDGGRTQYEKAKETIRQHNLTGIEVLSLAKEEGKHSSSLNKETLFCSYFPKGIQLSPVSKSLQFFQKIRDEAHRFALGAYRKKQSSSFFSPTEKIPGIGKIKRMRLLQTFKSWKQVMKASREELAAIPGLTKKDIDVLLERSKLENPRIYPDPDSDTLLQKEDPLY